MYLDSVSISIGVVTLYYRFAGRDYSGKLGKGRAGLYYILQLHVSL